MDIWDGISGLATVVCWIAFAGGLGYVIGRTRNREWFGFFLGLLLGPFGWLIVAVMPTEKSGGQDYPLIKCPACLGEIPAIASRCRHCGSALFQQEELPPPPRRAYYLMREDKTEGPFTLEQVADLLRANTISAETLCARDGDKRWVPVGNVVSNRF